MGILGKAAREGMIDAGMALKISTAINVLCGVQFYFFPDSAIKMYKVSVPVTTLGKKMFGFAGATLIALAAYLNVAAEKGAAAASTWPPPPTRRTPSASCRPTCASARRLETSTTP